MVYYLLCVTHSFFDPEYEDMYAVLVEWVSNFNCNSIHVKRNGWNTEEICLFVFKSIDYPTLKMEWKMKTDLYEPNHQNIKLNDMEIVPYQKIYF